MSTASHPQVNLTTGRPFAPADYARLLDLIAALDEAVEFLSDIDIRIDVSTAATLFDAIGTVQKAADLLYEVQLRWPGRC